MPSGKRLISRSRKRLMKPDDNLTVRKWYIWHDERIHKNAPDKTFEELLAGKMKRKHMTREEALEDIYQTAKKSKGDDYFV